MCTQPRLLHMEQTEGTLWRIVDVAPALMGRSYPAAAAALAAAGGGGVRWSLEIIVEKDDLAPWNTGTYLMTIEHENGGAAVVEKTEASSSPSPGGRPTVKLGVKAMASLWSGYRSAVELRGMGLLRADSDETLWMTNAVFATEKPPHVINHF
eukprot:COSAG06_NODE_1582_length_9017_cov_11.406593_6_plen_153_part_00